ncbi:MAG: radical SAM protein [Thermodesulfobacteriota bacterium]
MNDQVCRDQAVFGPVPSRRLGMSLGVDLLVPKTCSLDCVYCELGAGGRITTARGPQRDAGQVLAEVAERLAELDRPPDFITLAGSGEPTLHAGLGRVIAGLKAMCPARVAVLTNATLTPDAQVRSELCLADVLAPSLDAASQAVFRRVNRPAPGLEIEAIIAGLIALRRQHRGEFWLEVLLAAGYNDSDEELERIMAAARRIGPDKVQLNTVVRPPALKGVRPLDDARLKAIAAAFPAPAEVIAPPQATGGADRGALARQVVEMTRRRPCTIEDIMAMAGLDRAGAGALVAELGGQGQLREEAFGATKYYRGV